MSLECTDLDGIESLLKRIAEAIEGEELAADLRSVVQAALSPVFDNTSWEQSIAEVMKGRRLARKALAEE